VPCPLRRSMAITVRAVPRAAVTLNAFSIFSCFLHIQPPVFQAPRQAVIRRACDFFDRFVSHAYPSSCISTLDKAVILSEAPRRPIANEELYARSRRACPERSRGNPGDAWWQMLSGAFRPQTTSEDKKVTNGRYTSLLSQRRTVIRHYHEG
jgi:hypothetical protein